MQIAYLDNSATTRPCSEAVEKINFMLTQEFGNPSSLHSAGIRAQQEIETARQIAADAIGAQSKEIYFTSGGTEANNLAVFGAVQSKRRGGKKIITTSMEHSSVLSPMKELEKEGFEVVYLSGGENGCFSLTELEQVLDGDVIFASMMLVNNETGAIQPVEQAAKLIRRKAPGCIIHCDAVQAFGKLPIKAARLGADMITVSGHKIHGPKGVGALYIKNGVRIIPRVYGGSQERGMRPGTENAAFIAGFGAAVKCLPDINAQTEKTAALKEYAVQKISALEGIRINSPSDGLPYILNFSCPGIRSQVMLQHLSANGVYVSSGSACSKGQKSHVLAAMGYDNARIDSALRVSFSRYSTFEEIDLLCSTLEDGQKKLVRSRG